MPKTIHHRPQQRTNRRQNGFVMVSAVLFLLVLTILGLSSMSGTILEEKMTGFYRDRQIAFEAAEAALRDGELDALSSRISGETGFVAGCGSTTGTGGDAGLCAVETDGTPVWVDLETGTATKTGWVEGNDEGHSVKYGQFTGATAFPSDAVAKPPRYIIEVMKLPEQQLKLNAAKSYKFAYRITAVGFGRRVSTRVMLQSVVTSS